MLPGGFPFHQFIIAEWSPIYRGGQFQARQPFPLFCGDPGKVGMQMPPKVQGHCNCLLKLSFNLIVLNLSHIKLIAEWQKHMMYFND